MNLPAGCTPEDLDVDEPGTLAALTPRDAGEVMTLQRAAFVTEAQAHRDLHLPPLTQTLADLHAELGEQLCHGWGIREAGRLVACVRAHLSGDTAELTGQHSHANLQLYRRHGYRQTHTTQAGAYLLVHLAKARPRRPGGFSSRLGCS